MAKKSLYEKEYLLDRVLNWHLRDESTLREALVDAAGQFYFDYIWDGEGDLNCRWYGEVAIVPPSPETRTLSTRLRVYLYEYD